MKKSNAYAGLGDVLAKGFDSGLMDDGNDQMVRLDDIEIRAQEREEMEDDDNTLAELGKSLRKQQLQAILLTPNKPGSAKPFLLVAGERRVRGARIEGLLELRARIQPMTDEEVEEARFAENIHRKNLTQIETAKRIQRDLVEKFKGDVDAFLASKNKGRPWLSKFLSLLDLPPQTKRLISENISADIGVINSVKQIEKVDATAAAALVDNLASTRGKGNVRAKVEKVKDDVKPSKAKQAAKATEGGGGSVATPKDRSHEEPGAVSTKKRGAADVTADVLGHLYVDVFEHGKSPQAVLKALGTDAYESAEAVLGQFYDAGKSAKDCGRAVMQGFRNGQFAADGAAALNLVAFLHGADSGAKFNVLNILGAVKA